jgi:hypothetical protein
MICYREHNEKLTLLKKIFSGVLVLQDVCWDTDPQCWTVHTQPLDFHLSTGSYGWISQHLSHLKVEHLYPECCSHCHGGTGTEQTDKEHHNPRWNLHHHLEWRNLCHVKVVKLILHTSGRTPMITFARAQNKRCFKNSFTTLKDYMSMCPKHLCIWGSTIICILYLVFKRKLF